MSKEKQKEKEQQSASAPDWVTEAEKSPQPVAVAVIPEQQSGELAAPIPIDFAADANVGNEEVTAADIALPYLSILQKNSPQVDPDGPGYVEGAKVGDIFNNLTMRLFDGKTGITIVPCYYVRKFIEWVPRELGGGFVKAYDISDPAVLAAVKADRRNDKGKLLALGGVNLLTETAQHYALHVIDAAWGWAVISMASTQHKASRTLNSLISGIKINVGGKSVTPARFSHIYQLTTKLESKDKYTWYGWQPTLVKRVDDPALYSAGKAYFNAVSAGMVSAGAPPTEEPPAEGDGEDKPF